MRENKESIKAFKTVIQIEPNHLKSLYELALFYRDLKEYNLALAYCDQILKIDPNHSKTNFLSIKIRKFSCDWVCYEKDTLYGANEINNAESIGPFSSFSFNDLALQKKIAEGYAAKFSSLNSSLNKILPYKNHKKISDPLTDQGNFDHPVSNLIVELIEKHDQSKFEIYGFSLVDWPDDEVNIRLKKAFTKFINVENKHTKDIVSLAREDGD